MNLSNSKNCVATIFNKNNNGGLVQASTMLQLFTATGIVWQLPQGKQYNAHSSNANLWWNKLNLSENFHDIDEAAYYINNNFDTLIVGSDEVWKLTFASRPAYKLPHPSPFYGSKIKIKKIALAISTGLLNVAKCNKAVLSRIHKDLSTFELIYVRDQKSYNDLLSMGVKCDGILPDPTFAVTFLKTNKLPTDNIIPPEWFASFSNLPFHTTDRMHELLACIRGNTPCLSVGSRPKNIELIKEFKLPTGTKENVIHNWPYAHIATKCQEYKKIWDSLLKTLL